MRRLLRTAAALALAGAAVPFVGVAPAGADERPGITVSPEQTVSRQYPGILASDPVTPQEADPNPENCKQLPSCALVPITLQFPKGFDKSGDYFVRVKLEWKTEEVPNPATGEATSNDLDMYIYERPKKKTATGSDTYSRKSATGAQPEQTALDRPQGTVLDVVINNFSGANEGFKLTAFWQVGGIASPFESVEPGRTPQRTGGEESFSAPVDLSDVPDSTSSEPIMPSEPVGAGEPSLLPIGEDSDLSAILGGGLASAELDEDAASALANSQRQASSGPLPEPSTLALILSLIVAPAAFAAAGAAWFVRRRPVALQAA